MQETQVRSLGREDILGKVMATHSSILAWRIPWTEEPGRPQSTGSQRVGHDLSTEHAHISDMLLPFPRLPGASRARDSSSIPRQRGRGGTRAAHGAAGVGLSSCQAGEGTIWLLMVQASVGTPATVAWGRCPVPGLYLPGFSTPHEVPRRQGVAVRTS